MSTAKKPKRRYLRSKLRIAKIALEILERDEWRRGYFNTSDTEMMEEIFDRMNPNVKCVKLKASYAYDRLNSETKYKNFPFVTNTVGRGRNKRTEFKLAA